MAFPVDIDGTWIDAGLSLDGGELRRADAGIFNSDGSVYGAVGGVVRHSAAALVTIDASDNVTILPQSVVIPGNPSGATSPAVGVYRGGLQTSQTNVLPTARNATNPRVDLVVAQALDASITGSTNKIRFTTVTGTPAASPSPPTLPFMAVELGRISLPALGGGPATVDLSYRKFATAIGAPLMVPTFARLPTSGLAFQRAQAMDTGVYYDWNGTSWTSQAPHFRGNLAASTFYANATPLAFVSAEDTDGGWSGGTYTVKKAGIYRISFAGRNGTPAITSQQLYANKNGSAFDLTGLENVAVNASFFRLITEERFAVNDTITVTVNAGWNTPSATTGNRLTIDWVRP